MNSQNQQRMKIQANLFKIAEKHLSNLDNIPVYNNEPKKKVHIGLVNGNAVMVSFLTVNDVYPSDYRAFCDAIVKTVDTIKAPCHLTHTYLE